MNETSVAWQLLHQPWWTYEANSDLFSEVYHWLNVIEGIAWLVLATLVIVRYFKYRRSVLEILYASLFVTFGISDFLESQAVDTRLIVIKLLNLIGLLAIRWYVIKRFYPESRTY